MSEAFIPLDSALQDKGCRAVLLEKLREGLIASHAVESYGADLIEWCVTATIEEIVNKAFQTKVERRVAKRILDEQSSVAKYIWAGSHGYLAIGDQAVEVVAFSSQSRKREGRCTVPKSVWQFAYIDESRHTVVYDDFSHLYRKEYMHVHIDDAAFRKIKHDYAQTAFRAVGRQSIRRDEVENYARNLVSGAQKYKLAEFISILKEEFGAEIGVYNTVDEHYGDIWRASAGRPLRQPKNPKAPNN